MYKERESEVYVLHFEKPYWSNCCHYVGCSVDVDKRIKEHRNGKGSLLVKYALEHGNDFTIGYRKKYGTRWEGRHAEKRLKKEGHLSRRCSICGGKYGTYVKRERTTA